MIRGFKLFDNKPCEWLAHRYYVLGQFDMCLNVAEQILRKNPNNSEALSLKGSVLRTKGRIEEALNCFQSAHQLEPDNNSLLIEIARCNFFLGRYQQSLSMLRNIAKTKEGRTWEVLHLIGVNLTKLKQYDEAIDQLQQALDADQRLETFIQICDISDALKNYQLLKDTIDEAQSLFPANTVLRKRIGKYLLLIGDHQAALQNFRYCYIQNHSDFESMLIAGSIEQHHLHNEVAMKLYRSTFPGLPNSPALWNNSALCILANSRKEAVISCCQKALFYAPFELNPLVNMGLTYLEMGLYCSAAIVLNKARKLHSNSIDETVNVGLGIALMNLKQFDEAIAVFSEEYQKSSNNNNNQPIDHRIVINLVICYYLADQKENSKKLFQYFLKLLKKEPEIEQHYPDLSVLKRLLGYKIKSTKNVH